MCKDKFYETEADRIRQHIRTELTMGQRLRNWWNYHWHLLAIGAAVLAVVVYMGLDLAIGSWEDYSVAWVGREYLPDEAAEAFETALAAFGEDRNGDDKVVVRLHQIPLDLGEIARRGSTSGQQEHAKIFGAQCGFEQLSKRSVSSGGSPGFSGLLRGAVVSGWKRTAAGSH